MIDLEKQYRTEAGYEVKLSFIDDEKVYGHYKNKWGSWCDGQWSVDEGEYFGSISSGCDLVEVKPRIKQTLWLNLYKGIAYGYSTKEVADIERLNNGLACVKVEINCDEGEGL